MIEHAIIITQILFIDLVLAADNAVIIGLIAASFTPKIKKIKSPTKKSKEPSYIQSVYRILFVDLSISFDNVIGVVGAARGYIEYIIFGLVLSVLLTGALATYLANYIQKNIWIAYVGLIFVLLVALQLIIGGLMDYGVLTINEPFSSWF